MADVSGLVTELCRRTLGGGRTSGPRNGGARGPKRRDRDIRRLRSKLFEILLNFSNRVPAMHGDLPADATETHLMLAGAYDLRRARRFDDAHRLEMLLDKLADRYGRMPDSLKPVLLFLACLTNSQRDDTTPVLGENMVVPKVLMHKEDAPLLPVEPLQYGESRLFGTYSSYYMHYPREMFEDVGVETERQLWSDSDRNALFEVCPGYDLNGNRLFMSSEFPSKGGGASGARPPYFGALFSGVHRSGSVNLRLELPQLSDTLCVRPVDFKLAQKLQDDDEEDAGFFDSETPMSTGGLAEENVWETVLKASPATYRSWETVGRYDRRKEKPYLTESGPTAADAVRRVLPFCLQRLDPSIGIPRSSPVAADRLTKALVDLLMGIPSEIFTYAEEERCFRMHEGTNVEGLSPESLAGYAREFLESGNNYRRLASYSASSAASSGSSSGRVTMAFKQGLSAYLHQYQHGVMMLASKRTMLLELRLHSQKLQKQLKFVVELCGLTGNEGGTNEANRLPSGLRLLSYLYRQTCRNCYGDHYYLLLYLLKMACAPYLQFLRQWVFEGVCDDPHEEFSVSVNVRFSTAKDENFWTKGYVASTGDVDSGALPFLSELGEDVFVCGKTVALMKLCCPEHCLFSADLPRPETELLLSERLAARVAEESETYRREMSALMDESRAALRRAKEARDREKSESLSRNRQRRLEAVASQKEKLENSRKLAAEKKKALFLELTAQVEEGKARRRLEKERQLRDEKRAEAVAEAKRLVEADLREEMMENYARQSSVQQQAARARWSSRRWLFPDVVSSCIREAEERSDATPEHGVGISERATERGEVGAVTISVTDARQSHPDQENSLARPCPTTASTSRSDRDLPDEIRRSLLDETGLPSWSCLQAPPMTAELLPTAKDVHVEATEETFNGTICPESGGHPVAADTDGSSIRVASDKPGDGAGSEWKMALRDDGGNAVLKFRGRNVHGHASDSTIQKLLYGPTPKPDKSPSTPAATAPIPLSPIQTSILPYCIIDFASLDDPPRLDPMATVRSGRWPEHTEDEDVSSSTHVPLPILLQQSLFPPVQAQSCLVNGSVVDYFLVDLDIGRHFVALRNFFFFHDGEFGEALGRALFDKMSRCRHPAELLNPVALNSVLGRALAGSLNGDGPSAENLSFSVKFVPHAFTHAASSVLNCLELHYKVDSLCNIVITSSNMDRYNKILGLLLQVKRSLWALNDVWYYLKRTAGKYNLDSSTQYRKLQIYRHEMQHFVRVVQSYVASQLLQITWKEFLSDLHQRVRSLDALRDAHARYLRRACYRCLLTKNAAPVLKFVQDVFTLIQKFRSQLLLCPWRSDPETGDVEHPSFPALHASYNVFKEYSAFLYKVFRKMIKHGYQPHLQDLLVLLDFNGMFEARELSDAR